MKRLWLPFFIGFVALLASCVDDNYTVGNGIDSTIGIDGTLGIPLVKANIKLVDVMPDNFGSFTIEFDGDLAYLYYSETNDFTIDFVSNINFTPSEQFVLPIAWMPEGMNAEYQDTLVYHFEDLNVEGSGQFLDSLMYASGEVITMYLYCDHELESNSFITFEMDPEFIVLNPDLYPDNTATFPITAQEEGFPIDMSGARVKFNGGDSLRIFVDMNITAGETITDGSITHRVDFSTIKPRITYGTIYEGVEICSVSDTQPFTYTSDLQADEIYLPFYNPSLAFTVLNSTGVKCRCDLDYVRVYATDGSYVEANFDGSASYSFDIEAVQLSEIQGIDIYELLSLDVSELAITSSATVDRDNGHTDQLFQIKGETIEYQFRVVAEEGSESSFVFDDSKMTIDLEATLPLRFASDKDNSDNNFYICVYDTIQADFSSLAESVLSVDGEEVGFDFIHVNNLPVDAEFTFSFLDASYRPIYDGEETITIAAAPVNSDGEVLEPSETNYDTLVLTGETCNEVFQNGQYLAVKYRIDSRELNDVWFHTNDWLQLKVGVYIKSLFTF